MVEKTRVKFNLNKLNKKCTIVSRLLNLMLLPSLMAVKSKETLVQTLEMLVQLKSMSCSTEPQTGIKQQNTF